MSKQLENTLKTLLREIAWKLYALACEYVPAWLEVLIVMALLALIGYGFLRWRDWDRTSMSASLWYPPE